MNRAKAKLMQRLAIVFGIVFLISIGFILDYGCWRPTSDVFILPGGMVWAFRMYYLESKSTSRY